MHYPIEPRNWIFVKGYVFLSFTKNMNKNVAKNLSKNVRGNYNQKLLDPAKQSATDALKTTSTKVIATLGLSTANKINNFGKRNGGNYKNS